MYPDILQVIYSENMNNTIHKKKKNILYISDLKQFISIIMQHFSLMAPPHPHPHP